MNIKDLRKIPAEPLNTGV